MEELLHFRPRLQVELLAVEPHAVGVVDLRAGLDAEQRVVRPGVLGADVMDVVRADDLQVEFARELEEIGGDLVLRREAVILDFDEKVLAAVDVDEAPRGPAGILVAALKQTLRDERGEAAGERDEALGVFRQRLEVGARAVIETLQVRVGDQLEEIVVAGLVARQHAHVEDGLALLAAAGALEPRTLGEVDFAADQRLDAAGLRLEVEVDRPEKIPVVGERQRLHAQPGGAVHQAVDAAGAVEQAVVRVDVEMDEIGVGGRQGHANQDPAPKCSRRNAVERRRNGNGRPRPPEENRD